jgi:hypothetical protein
MPTVKKYVVELGIEIMECVTPILYMFTVVSNWPFCTIFLRLLSLSCQPWPSTSFDPMNRAIKGRATAVGWDLEGGNGRCEHGSGAHSRNLGGGEGWLRFGPGRTVTKDDGAPLDSGRGVSWASWWWAGWWSEQECRTWACVGLLLLAIASAR